MERKNIITFAGQPFTLLGTPVNKGDKAPDFTVVANDLSPRTLADYKGKVCIISVVPSLDTGVCDLQTKRFNAEAGALGDHVRILTVSCDLPFAQARWCGATGTANLETLSDYKDVSFGMNYGVLIKELRLLTRAIFVVDSAGTVTYTEIVPEVTNAVNFEAALEAARAAK
ncbi:MAG: thiol peroxidase [Deltaproteobacteria bacterium]|nr:thiol peroxidase [Deltaproteobacteria bacterium]